MYGGFEEKEDSDNSQSSDGKILASTQGKLDYIYYVIVLLIKSFKKVD